MFSNNATHLCKHLDPDASINYLRSWQETGEVPKRLKSDAIGVVEAHTPTVACSYGVNDLQAQRHELLFSECGHTEYMLCYLENYWCYRKAEYNHKLTSGPSNCQST